MGVRVDTCEMNADVRVYTGKRREPIRRWGDIRGDEGGDELEKGIVIYMYEIVSMKSIIYLVC